MELNVGWLKTRRQVWSTAHLRTHLTNRKWKPTESGMQRC